MPPVTAPPARIAQILDGLPFGSYHRRLITSLAVVGFIEAYATAMTGALVVSARGPLGLTGGQVRFLVVAPTITLVVSMLAASVYLSDRYSRRTILLAGVVWSTLGTLLTPLAPNASVLIVLRLFSGFGYGLALPAAYPLGAELLPAAKRSTFAWIYESLLGVGFTLTSVVGTLVAHAGMTNGWRLLPLPGGLFFFIAPVLIWFFVPESPRWLAERGRIADAWRTLDTICAKAGVAPPRHDEGECRQVAAPLPRFTELFGRGLRTRTVAAFAVWTAALVPFYVFSTLLPEIFVHEGQLVADSLALTIIVFAVSLPGKVVNGYLMERIGRRKTIAASLFASALGIALLMVSHSTPVLIAAEIVLGLTLLSVFPAVRMYITELFPTRIRGRGYFLAETTGRFIAGIPIPFILAGLVATPSVIFAVALAGVLIGAVVATASRVETRGHLDHTDPGGTK